jgi:DAACS family dicarboxylate/amino acid:cation (Na+ or H+) symporter
VALHSRIFLGLLLGAVLGVVCNRYFAVAPTDPGATVRDVRGNGLDDRFESVVDNAIEPAGKVFLRLILMVVVPLVFAALVLGVQGLGDIRRLGRLGLRTLLLTVTFSLCAVAIGMVLVNTLKPGAALSQEKRDALRDQYKSGATTHVEKAKQSKKLKDTLLDIIPENQLQEAV